MSKSIHVVLGALLCAVAGLALAGPASAVTGDQRADACPNATVRTQQDATGLAGCRAYELVSPAEKGGLPVFLSAGTNVGMTRASVDGNAAVFAAWGPLADATTGTPASYRSQRTAEGWKTSIVSPPHVNDYPEATGVNETLAAWGRASRDLNVGFIVTRDHFDPTDANDTYDLYEWRDGKTDLLSRGNGAERGVSGINGNSARSVPAVSDDGSHALFVSGDHLVPEDAGRTAGVDLYERTDGHTYLVNQANGGGLINTCGSQAGLNTFRHTFTQGGLRIIFEVPSVDGAGDPNPDCGVPTQIYMRDDHSSTINISASQRTSPDPLSASTYVGASADGNLVFFMNSARLTDDAPVGGGTYRYTVATGELELILDQFGTPIKISADGSRVYYLSNFADAPGGVDGNFNLYSWSAGEVTSVATDPTPALQLSLAGIEPLRTAVVTPDGRHFLIATEAQLTAFDNLGRQEVYLYSEGEGLTCVSCDPAGQRPNGSTVVSDASIAREDDDDQTPSIAADGKTVVFQTGDQLLAEDTDGNQDVYEYTDGRLSLVSDGHDRNASILIGMGGNGRDVFFTSGAGLVSGDTDGDLDIYDARRGGGWLVTPAPPAAPPCGGDVCQGGVQRPAGPVVAGSVLFGGPANPVLPERGRSTGKATVSKLSTVSGASTSLKVRVPGKGTIRASGSGLAGSSKMAGKAGTYAVAVKLTATAKKTLARKKRLVVSVSVRFTPASGVAQTVRVPVTFKQKKQSARRAGVLSHDVRKGQ